MANQEEVETAYVLEEISISEDSQDENIRYEEVQIEAEEESQDEVLDYETLVRQQQPQTAVEITETQPQVKEVQSTSTERPEVVDDFIRNFLVRFEMKRTLEVFQAEWYELQAKGKIKQIDISPVPDIYIRNQELREQAAKMNENLEKAQMVAEKAKNQWDKLRKEKDFHKMHHQRVQQEKQKLCQDIEKLKKALDLHEQRYKELAQKYEVAMKEKMLMKLERDRLQSKNQGLQESLNHLETSLQPATGAVSGVATAINTATKRMTGGATAQKRVTMTGTQGSRISQRNQAQASATTKQQSKDTAWPSERQNPFLNTTFEPVKVEQMSLFKTYRGHQMAVAGLAIHPKQPIVATSSDDHSWKI